MAKRIAYLGDTSLPGPASYLAGIMFHYQLPFLYVPSDRSPPADAWSDDIGLYVLSDYPAATFGSGELEKLAQRVQSGTGLLMLGGWESYHGLGGDYDRTPLAELLPVRMRQDDDRRNSAQPILVRPVGPHPILGCLPLEQPPGIGGYNEFTARPEAQVVLEGERYEVKCSGGKATFKVVGKIPLLVVAEAAAGLGRRACLATDVAPHWVGGLVDWGNQRLTVKRDGDFIEVGNWYAEFFRNLLVWCLQEKN